MIGAATAAKWPGRFVLVPLVVATWGQWRRLAYAGGSPWRASSSRARSPSSISGEAASTGGAAVERPCNGSLGAEDDSFAAVAFTSHLWDALGPGSSSSR